MTFVERLFAAIIGFLIGALLCYAVLSIIFILISHLRSYPVEPVGIARYILVAVAGLYLASYGFTDPKSHDNMGQRWREFFARRDIRLVAVALPIYFLISIAWFWSVLPSFAEYEWNIFFSLPFLVLGVLWLVKNGQRWIAKGKA